MDDDNGNSKVTLAILKTQLGNVRDTLIHIEASIGEVQRDVRGINQQGLERRVTVLEDNLRWFTRAVVGGFIAVAVAFVSAVIR